MKRIVSMILTMVTLLCLTAAALGDFEPPGDMPADGNEINAAPTPENPEPGDAGEEEKTPGSGEDTEAEEVPEPEIDPDWSFDPNVDYMALMIEAAVAGDLAGGADAMEKRNEKIEKLFPEYMRIDFTELYLLAKIMYAEAGSAWLSEDWKMCVGEVVLNRVDSSEFPNTIAEVLAQPGQYYGANSSYFNNLRPSLVCAKLAQRLLEGERLMEPSVVFQANFTQGSGIHTSYYDKYLGWTYFCHSSRKDQYVSS